MNNLGGAFQIARQIFESELWLNKPSSWFKIWIYILGKANHTDNKLFKRGENFFNFSKEQSLIGKDISIDVIKKFITYAKRMKMIDTEKTTRGLRVFVLNYDNYQSLNNYKSKSESALTQPSARNAKTGTTETKEFIEILEEKSDNNEKVGTTEARQKHDRSTMINKNDKNDKNDINIYSEPSSQIEVIKPVKELEPVNDEVNQVMKSFYDLGNKGLNFGNKTERLAAKWLVDQYGLEKSLNTITYAMSVQSKKFAPVINTPYQLKTKLNELINFYKREQTPVKGQAPIFKL